MTHEEDKKMYSDAELRNKSASLFFTTTQANRLNFFFEQQGEIVQRIYKNTSTVCGVMVLFILFNKLSKDIRNIIVKSQHIFNKNLLLPSTFDDLLLKKYRKLCTSGEYILKCKYCDFISHLSYTMEHMAFVHDRHFGFGLKTCNPPPVKKLKRTSAAATTSTPTAPIKSSVPLKARKDLAFVSHCIFQTTNSIGRHLFRDHFTSLTNYRYKQLDLLFGNPLNPLNECYRTYIQYLVNNGKIHTLENCNHSMQIESELVMCQCIKKSIIFYERFHNELFEILNTINLTNWRESRFEAIGYIRPQKLENPQDDDGVSLSEFKYQKKRKHTRTINSTDRIYTTFENLIKNVYFDFFVKECPEVIHIQNKTEMIDLCSDEDDNNDDANANKVITTVAAIPPPQPPVFNSQILQLQPQQIQPIGLYNPVYYVIVSDDNQKQISAAEPINLDNNNILAIASPVPSHVSTCIPSPVHLPIVSPAPSSAQSPLLSPMPSPAPSPAQSPAQSLLLSATPSPEPSPAPSPPSPIQSPTQSPTPSVELSPAPKSPELEEQQSPVTPPTVFRYNTRLSSQKQQRRRRLQLSSTNKKRQRSINAIKTPQIKRPRINNTEAKKQLLLHEKQDANEETIDQAIDLVVEKAIKTAKIVNNNPSDSSSKINRIAEFDECNWHAYPPPPAHMQNEFYEMTTPPPPPPPQSPPSQSPPSQTLSPLYNPQSRLLNGFDKHVLNGRLWDPIKECLDLNNLTNGSQMIKRMLNHYSVHQKNFFDYVADVDHRFRLYLKCRELENKIIFPTPYIENNDFSKIIYISDEFKALEKISFKALQQQQKPNDAFVYELSMSNLNSPSPPPSSSSPPVQPLLVPDPYIDDNDENVEKFFEIEVPENFEADRENFTNQILLSEVQELLNGDTIRPKELSTILSRIKHYVNLNKIK